MAKIGAGLSVPDFAILRLLSPIFSEDFEAFFRFAL
jgi:hypothetical protein